VANSPNEIVKDIVPPTGEQTYDLLAGEDLPVEGEEDEKIITETEKENKVEKKGTKEKEEEEESEKEEKPEEPELELEDEEKEIPEEELELVTPVRRKEILAAFPDLFKKFPYLEKAYYREQKYTEILPTLEDARSAVEKSQALDNFAAQLLQGDPRTVLKEVASDKAAFGKLVDNYLPALFETNQDAYFHVIGSVVKPLIFQMVSEGKRSNNEALQAAAVILNQFAFGTSEYAPPAPFSKEVPKEETGLQQERAKFVEEKFNYARNDLATKTSNALKTTVDAHIDPKGVMTSYLKSKATKDALEFVESTLVGDTRFRAIMDRLWEKAFDSNFSPSSLSAIRSAYLSTAKTVLPQAISRARNDALKGLGRTQKVDEEEKDKRGPITPGRAASPSGSGKKGEIQKGERTIDFLMRD